MTELVFEVPGRPVSWARKNVVNGRPVTDKAQRVAKLRYRLVANAAALAYWRATGTAWDMTGDYCVQVDAYYPDERKGDIDRIPGLLLDSFEGVLFKTDRQVSELQVTRQTDKARPRLVVRVSAIDHDPGLEASNIIHG